MSIVLLCSLVVVYIPELMPDLQVQGDECVDDLAGN